MSEKLPRRTVLLGIAGATVAIAGGTEFFANREFSPFNEINDPKKQELQSLAKSLVDHGLVRTGNFSPIEIDTSEGKKKVQPVLNAERIAETLLYMCYMDGGDKNVDKMLSFLKKTKGLLITELTGISAVLDYGTTNNVGDFQTINDAFGEFGVSLDTGLMLQISPDVFSLASKGDTVFAHELYHVDQQARDGQLGITVETLISQVLSAAIALSIMNILYQKFTYSIAGKAEDTINKLIPRRHFLRGLSSFVASRLILTTGLVSSLVVALIATNSYSYFSPMEAQAYAQGGDGNADRLGDLTSREPVKSTVTNIVTFEPVN